MSSQQSRKYPIKTIVVLLKLLSWLPRGVMRCLGWCIAWIAWHVGARAARTTIQNIRHCYPDLTDKEQRLLGQSSLRHTACAICEMPAMLLASYPRLKRWIRSEHGANLLKDVGDSPPPLILIPHFGNWEFLVTYMQQVCPYTCLYSPRRLYQLDEFVNQCRSRFGGEFLPVTYQGLREVVRRLKAGKALIVLPDQLPAQGSGTRSRFMNQPIMTGTLVHSLVRRGNLRVVTLAAERVRGGFDIHVQEVDAEIFDQDESVSTLALDRAIESVVSIDAAQYQWEYKRFRGVADIYQ